MALDIERIKEELSQATVLELKQLIDALKEAWGVNQLLELDRKSVV